MSAWMEILNTKQTETNKTKSTRHSAHSIVPGGGGGGLRGGAKQANRRQKRLRKHTGNNPSVQITAGKSTTTKKTTPGLLQTLTSKLTGTEKSVRYVALHQADLEQGSPLTNVDNDSDRDLDTSSSQNSLAGSGSDSSSSVEDLFVATNSRRKQRRKMTRKGTYSMRETFENSRQFIYRV
ncbi:uncharacterized protein LOC111682769 isoform X3 [Lucilia cuprina]|uniref:uncharacterized protein LOC111682769 isoform X3 n=1 Tax=Lucilia cuprina TaxID=7375 RepID=UPI001F06E577|nr:uncharacterized protein LOC111682769 isoform X3 [Lucilia cuprina]